MTQEIDHLALWQQVEKTPSSAIKPATVSGQQITAINTNHLIKLATKVFGPAGIGWGYRIDTERFDQGAPVMLKGQVIGHELTHTCQLTLWYEFEGKRGEISQFGHTRAVYMTNAGKFTTDGEAPKKSATDAMKKCLSMLGFAADVFAGKFDDPGYAQERQLETAIEQGEDVSAEIQRKRDEFKDWLERSIATLGKIPHPASVQKAHASMVPGLHQRANLARLDEQAAAYAERQLAEAAEQAVEALMVQRQARKTTTQQEEQPHD